MAYDKKFRKQAIAYKDTGHTFKELKEAFGICSDRYYRWKELLETTGSLEDKKVCERKRKINKDELRKALEEKPDMYLYELAERFDCTVQAIFYALRKMKITLKKDVHLFRKVCEKTSGVLRANSASRPGNHRVC